MKNIVEKTLTLAIRSKETADCWIRKAVYEDNLAHNETAKFHLEKARSYCVDVIESPSALNYETNQAKILINQIDETWE